MPQFIKVAERSEIADGTGECVEVEGKRIAVFNVDSSVQWTPNDECMLGYPSCGGAV